MKKLCFITNVAPSYREAIFSLIDKEFECDWYVGDRVADIKTLNYSLLNNVTVVKNYFLLGSPLYYQSGIVSLINRRCYNTYLILGDVFCISTWLFLIYSKFFHHQKRIYFWTHGWYGREGFVKHYVKKLFFKFADGIFLYGNYAKKIMKGEGFDERKLYVIHNSLWYDKQLIHRNSISHTSVYKSHFGNDFFNLIFIGRLTKVKRLDLLIHALDLIRSKGLNLNLTLIGDGVEKEKLFSLAQSLSLENRVWFYGGSYSEENNALLLYNADLCVAPGNVGLTAIHCMMFGTPVATHSKFCNQMPEFESIKEGLTGTFFEFNNINSIADTIIKWFELNSFKRELIRQNCYEEIDTQWTPQFQIRVLKEHLVL